LATVYSNLSPLAPNAAHPANQYASRRDILQSKRAAGGVEAISMAEHGVMVNRPADKSSPKMPV
jgi:hypothetical protein